MAIVSTLAGLVLIGTACVEIFQTLFHPAGRGGLSDWTARIVWRMFRALASRRPGLLTYAGPFAILTIIVSWAAFTCIGFALVYLPRLAYGFAYESGVSIAQRGGFSEAINTSLASLITLSNGALPRLAYLRFLGALEAVIGFGLLTASVSWLLSVYPVLESRRAVAERATLLHNAELEIGVDVITGASQQAPDWIVGVAADLANLRNQLAQFPIAYYFHVGEKQTALSGALAYLSEIGDRAAASQNLEMRIAGTVLGGAVHNFLDLLATDFLHMPTNDKKAILLAYAKEQMNDIILRDNTVPYSRRAA